MNNIEISLKLYKSFVKQLNKYLSVLRNNDYEKLDYLICENRQELNYYIYQLENEEKEVKENVRR